MEDAGAAGELRANVAARLDVEGGNRSEVVSRFGHVLGKGFCGWNFFRFFFEQLQFQSLHNKHCFIFLEVLA